MPDSTRMETVPRSVCFQMLGAAGCSWERQVELFHVHLAHLDGPERAAKLAELVLAEREKRRVRVS